jgi:hypothetical protein
MLQNYFEDHLRYHIQLLLLLMLHNLGNKLASCYCLLNHRFILLGDLLINLRELYVKLLGLENFLMISLGWPNQELHFHRTIIVINNNSFNNCNNNNNNNQIMNNKIKNKIDIILMIILIL